jgi:glycosyltransferase involved in cell wall biosynthesis
MKGHVVHVRDSNFLGGPEKQILRYIAATAEDFKNSLFVFSDQETDFEREARRAGADVHRLGSASWSALQELRRFFVQERPTLVCTHGYKADILATLAARASKTRTAAFQRGNTAENSRVILYEILQRLCLPLASYVVALSATQRAELERHPWLRKRIRKVVNSQIPMSVDRHRSRGLLTQRFALPHSARIVVWSGRLSPEKGAVDFVRAAMAVADDNAQFLIFGGGVQESTIRSLIRSAGNQNVHVHLVGFHSDFAELLAGADLLVNSSHREQMPNVVLEAMASAVPVIATRVGAVAELSGPERAIHLVESGDIANITSGIQKLLADNGECQRMAAAALRRVTTEFSHAEQARQLRELIAEASRG